MIIINTTVVSNEVRFHCDNMTKEVREDLVKRLSDFRVPHESRFEGKTIVVKGDNYVDYQMVLSCLLYIVTEKINKQIEQYQQSTEPNHEGQEPALLEGEQVSNVNEHDNTKTEGRVSDVDIR